MDLNLDSGTPTDDATGLTEGAAYSVYHRGSITASVVVGGAHLVIYDSRLAGSFYIPKLPGTVIRFALANGATEADITVI